MIAEVSCIKCKKIKKFEAMNDVFLAGWGLLPGPVENKPNVSRGICVKCLESKELKFEATGHEINQ